MVGSISALVAADGALSLGDSGIAVKILQKRLALRGYGLTGTGYFGNLTDIAVTDYQLKHGLKPDGIVGPVTARSIDDENASTPTTPQVVKPAAGGRPPWLIYGLSLLGTKEGAGSKDNPAIIDWAEEEGGDIAANYKHDATPWCALFANHILTKCDLKGTETLWALDFAGKWPAVRLSGPALGAFAPMKRPGGGHITVVAGKTSAGLIAGLGGNQGDAVSIRGFPRDRLDRGFWWPAKHPLPTRIGFDTLPVVSTAGASINEA
ncbi:TIGR02594 family protein [Rhodopseudomonas faecalis]|uniref:NlpC/P60 family protein n=1 Tax=Rhodopseudomonas faecalis TaxID=99655 RepID=UPI0011B4C36A|nr:TIGR02594 family protein [Rhodopseudomonas faecalis]